MATIDEVLTKLLERTDEGKVNWKPSADEHVFVAIVGGATVLIRQDSGWAPILRVYNKANKEIEALDGSERRGQEWLQQLHELFLKARRAALEADSELEELLKTLETGA